MMPAQYGSMNHYDSPSLDPQNYPSMGQHPYSGSRTSQHQSTPSRAYAPSYTSASTAQGPKSRMPGEHTILPPYQHSPGPRTPFQEPLASMRASPIPMTYPPTPHEPTLNPNPHSYPYTAVHTNISGQGLNPLTGNNTSYPPSV